MRTYTFDIEDGKLVGETDTIYRFSESGIEATARDLRKAEAGRMLTKLAKAHQVRHNCDFLTALKVVMNICPQETRDYFRQ